ncbi:MAG: hypothetical protein ACLSE8_09025 [Parasutterella sp.]
MAENIKRANLSVVEIAEFIADSWRPRKTSRCSRKLGLNKAIVSQYASWTELPECIKEALTSKKSEVFSLLMLFSKLGRNFQKRRKLL